MAYDFVITHLPTARARGSDGFMYAAHRAIPSETHTQFAQSALNGRTAAAATPTRLMLMERHTTPTDSKRFRLRLDRKQKLFSVAFNLCALAVRLPWRTQQNQILFLFLAVHKVTTAHCAHCRGNHLQAAANYHQIVEMHNPVVCVHCASGNYLIVALNKVAAAKKINILLN